MDFNAQATNQKAISDMTLSIVRDVKQLSSSMSSNYAPHLNIDIQYQDNMANIDASKPVSALKFMNPDNDKDVYARLDVFDNGNNGFECKLYEGNEAEPLIDGAIEDIRFALHNIVTERMGERNTARVYSAMQVAERIEAPSQYDL